MPDKSFLLQRVAFLSSLANGDVFSYNIASCHVCSAVTAAIYDFPAALSTPFHGRPSVER